MKLFKILFITIIAFSIISCDKDDDTFDSKSFVVGSWVNPQYIDTTYQVIKYDKSQSLIDNEYGFTFNADYTFIERKNSGWCGTPPISYSDFEGLWDDENPNVNIDVGYWGGMVNYKWKVLSVDNESLTIEKIEEDYSEIGPF